MENPKDSRPARKNRGIKAEDEAQKRLGGRHTFASGAMDHDKGDIELDKTLIESKSTVTRTLSVKLDWLQKIAQEALEKNKEPALLVQFTKDDGRLQPQGGWIMIKESYFTELTND